MSSNEQIPTSEALQVMRGHVEKLKQHKPSPELIPIMLDLIEATLVILERQDLR
jgi:hypothetical protein